jgi:hypothetical protein
MSMLNNNQRDMYDAIGFVDILSLNVTEWLMYMPFLITIFSRMRIYFEYVCCSHLIKRRLMKVRD